MLGVVFDPRKGCSAGSLETASEAFLLLHDPLLRYIGLLLAEVLL